MIAELSLAVGALKATNDLIRGVLAADKALSQADLKLRLADAAQSLLDARVAVMDAQAAIDSRDAEIARLSEALANKANVIRHMEGYYEADESGRAIGSPYCPRCYEKDHALYHITYLGRLTTDPCLCPVCKTQYAKHRMPKVGPVESASS